MNEKNISFLKEKGFDIIEYISYNNIIAIDTDGYKYKLNINNVKHGMKSNRFMRNPFVLDNIRRFLELNYPHYELLDHEYVNSKTKMRFICKNHKEKGIQYNTVDNIVNNHHACKYCSYEQMRDDRVIDLEIIMKRLEELGLVYVDRYTANHETHVKFICPTHKDKGVQDIVWDHLKTCGVGCPYCTGRYKTTEEFISEMKSINHNIEIIGEYNGSENPVKCRCKICNHIWSPIGRSLKNGQGCPGCSTSKGEIKVKEYLDLNNISYVQQKTFEDCYDVSKLKFDFYLPDYNCIIEYDGEQHFFPVDFANRGIEWANKSFDNNKRKDNIKNEYCKNNGIKIIRIPYYDYDNIEIILASNLLGAIFV